MSTDRTFEIYNIKTGSWQSVLFEELKKGDTLRMLEDGKLCTDDEGKTVWIADSNLFLNEHNELSITMRPSRRPKKAKESE